PGGTLVISMTVWWVLWQSPPTICSAYGNRRLRERSLGNRPLALLKDGTCWATHAEQRASLIQARRARCNTAEAEDDMRTLGGTFDCVCGDVIMEHYDDGNPYAGRVVKEQAFYTVWSDLADELVDLIKNPPGRYMREKEGWDAQGLADTWTDPKTGEL